MATERVKIYLRAAGVSDSSVLEKLSRQIVDASTPPEGSPEAINSQAVHRAIVTLQAWLDDRLDDY